MAVPPDSPGWPLAVASPGPTGSWGAGRRREGRASQWLKRTSRRLWVPATFPTSLPISLLS